MAEIIRIDEHTWRFEDEYVRFFLLEGNRQAALIDSGFNCANAADIAKTITDKPVILVNTHGDGDHTSGSAGFSDIYMHIEDYVNCGMAGKYPNTRLIELNDEEELDLGDRRLKFYHIPGHTKGSLAILDIDNRVLYAGDSVQKGHIFMFGPHRDTETYENSLDRLIALEDKYDTIYASHDEYKLPGNYAREVKSAWQQVRRGELDYEMTELHGCSVRSYTAAACGFYLQ